MKKYADGGKHMDAKQDKPMMQKVAKQEVMKHEKTMHKGKKMADGGMAMKKMMMADGGYVGCGKRSMQDYGKK